MSPSHDHDRQSASFAVIRLLATRPQLSQRELAFSLGMSLGKVNYCLRALISTGLVKAENYRNSRNTRGYLYLLTPAGVSAKAQLTRDFLSRKVVEYEALRLEIEQLREEHAQAAAVAHE